METPFRRLGAAPCSLTGSCNGGQWRAMPDRRVGINRLNGAFMAQILPMSWAVAASRNARPRGRPPLSDCKGNRLPGNGALPGASLVTGQKGAHLPGSIKPHPALADLRERSQVLPRPLRSGRAESPLGHEVRRWVVIRRGCRAPAASGNAPRPWQRGGRGCLARPRHAPRHSGGPSG